MFTDEEVKQIAEYLKYSYSQREWLSQDLESKIEQNGVSWQAEVSALLADIAIAEDSYETQLAAGEVKRYEVEDSFEVENFEDRGRLQGQKTLYYNELSKLFKLLELYPLTDSNYVVR